MEKDGGAGSEAAEEIKENKPPLAEGNQSNKWDHVLRQSQVLQQAWELREQTRQSAAGEIGAGFQYQEATYKRQAEEVLPQMRDALVAAAQANEQETLNELMQGLSNIEQKNVATEALLDESLTEKQRLDVLVTYCNTFGFIAGVDALSHAIKSGSVSETVQTQVAKLYKTIEADDVTQIMAELSEVYEAVNFQEYALNSKELTQKEGDLLEGVTGMVAEVQQKDQYEVRILGVGAGTGRNELELAERGYKHITAFDYEQKHIDYIKKQNPAIRAVKGDWDFLKNSLDTALALEATPQQPANEYKADVAEALGRTVSHKREMQGMLHLFDEVGSVLSENGAFVFDQPDVDWGVYKDRIDKLKGRLGELGITNVSAEQIFDGPDQEHKYNRLVLRPEQIHALASLLGYTVTSEDQEAMLDNGEIKNRYFHLQKQSDFQPQALSREAVHNHLQALGLLKPGVDFNMPIKAWGMTLGQAMVYGLDNDNIRTLNARGKAPKVIALRDQAGVTLSAMSSRWTVDRSELKQAA